MTQSGRPAETDCRTEAFFWAVSFEADAQPSYRDWFIASGLLVKNSGEEAELSLIDAFIEPRQRPVDSGTLTGRRHGPCTGTRPATNPTGLGQNSHVCSATVPSHPMTRLARQTCTGDSRRCRPWSREWIADPAAPAPRH